MSMQYQNKNKSLIHKLYEKLDSEFRIIDDDDDDDSGVLFKTLNGITECFLRKFWFKSLNFVFINY